MSSIYTSNNTNNACTHEGRKSKDIINQVIINDRFNAVSADHVPSVACCLAIGLAINCNLQSIYINVCVCVYRYLL